MITRRFLPAQFQPVQRRFPRHRCAGLARARQLPRQHRQHRIVPQLVVVIEVLIPERNPKHPLADQGGHRVLDQILTAMIAKAGRKSIHQIDRSIGRAKKQPTRIRTLLTIDASEISDISQRLLATLQHNSGVIFDRKRPHQCGGCPTSLRPSGDLRRGEGGVSIILRRHLPSALKMTSWRPKSTTRRPGFPIENSAFAPRVVRIPVALAPRMTRVISSSSWGRA